MKRTMFTLLACAMLLASAALAQNQPPQYFSIYTEHIQLGHQQHFEAAVAALWPALKKAGGAFPVFAGQSVSEPGSYTFVVPMASMADVDSNNATFGKVFAQDPGLGSRLSQYSNGNSSQIIAPRPDLSYQPATPRLADGQGVFGRITWLYVHPQHAVEIESAFKEFAALNKSKGINDGFTAYQGVTGEGPLFLVRTVALSEADFFAQAEKNAQKTGPEGAALLAKVGPMIKRIEYSASVSRPDLSYPQP